MAILHIGAMDDDAQQQAECIVGQEEPNATGEVCPHGEQNDQMPSRRGPTSKMRLSDHCGGNTVQMVVNFEYGRSGLEGYLGNVE